MIFEICIDSVQGLHAARETRAERVELCAGLIEGGTTPSLGLIEAVLAGAGRVLVHVLIRARGGDFVYSATERAVMRRDVQAAVDAGAHGVVIGALTPAGEVDAGTVRELMGAAGAVPVTFHRAFDHARDPIAALDTLIDLGVARVLTSGQQPSAAEGTALIGTLQRRSAGRIGILAGGGITAANAAQVAATGVSELHFSARVPQESAPQGPVSFGPGTPMRTSRRRIAEIMAAVR